MHLSLNNFETSSLCSFESFTTNMWTCGSLSQTNHCKPSLALHAQLHMNVYNPIYCQLTLLVYFALWCFPNVCYDVTFFFILHCLFHMSFSFFSASSTLVVCFLLSPFCLDRQYSSHGGCLEVRGEIIRLSELFRGATTAEKLRGYESQHRGACAPRPVKGRAGCWVREGVTPCRCEGPGVSPPENIWKLRC